MGFFDLFKRKKVVENDRKEESGVFTSFVLLSEERWNIEQLKQDLAKEWQLVTENEQQDKDILIFETGGTTITIFLIPAPIPHGEAEEYAKNNFLWPEAEEVTKGHKAHLIVSVMGENDSLLEKGSLCVKVIASLCNQDSVIGIYTSGVVLQPEYYATLSQCLKDGETLPIYNWIWFGLYQNDEGICGYTYGMSIFGKDEIEVLGAKADPSELRDFLHTMASYVLIYDITLQDGETIGFSETDIHTVVKSKGVALPNMQTIKISYEPTN